MRGRVAMRVLRWCVPRWTKDSTAPLWQAWRVDQMMQVTRHQAECTARCALGKRMEGRGEASTRGRGGGTRCTQLLRCHAQPWLHRLARRVLARSEGVLAGVSSGAAVAAALALSATVEDAVIAVVVCDRGEASLEAGIFSKGAAQG